MSVGKLPCKGIALASALPFVVTPLRTLLQADLDGMHDKPIALDPEAVEILAPEKEKKTLHYRFNELWCQARPPPDAPNSSSLNPKLPTSHPNRCIARAWILQDKRVVARLENGQSYLATRLKILAGRG